VKEIAMRWLAALLVCISVTPPALAESEDDALALTLELANQIARVGGLSVDDPDALTVRLEAAMDRFEEEADARAVQWSMSYGVDVDASSVERHDAEGNPLPVDPDTLEENDRMRHTGHPPALGSIDGRCPLGGLHRDRG
jgi:hypothetical protein